MATSHYADIVTQCLDDFKVDFLKKKITLLIFPKHEESKSFRLFAKQNTISERLKIKTLQNYLLSCLLHVDI